jgi:hypothetical protein
MIAEAFAVTHDVVGPIIVAGSLTSFALTKLG